MKPIFKCPVCDFPLHHHQADYICDNGHNFAIAKEGYVNLLLAHHKKSKLPGDSPEMIRSRREFLSAGYYQPLADALTDLLATYLPDKKSSTILDAGCGEGYYSGYIKQHLGNAIQAVGIDISKQAVRYAAKRTSAMAFAVAQITRLPILNSTMDCILSIFAPRDSDEFLRVATDQALMIVVIPGDAHLLDLRKLIYKEIRPHPSTPLEKLHQQFHVVDRREINYRMTIDNPDSIQHLLRMTPFYWHISEKKKEQLFLLERLSTDISFSIHVFRRNDS